MFNDMVRVFLIAMYSVCFQGSFLLYSQEYKETEHQVNQYKTWLIGDDFELLLKKLPSEEKREEEWSFIRELQSGISEGDIQNIEYWNTGSPSYRWHQIITQLGERYPTMKNGGRMANLHAAIHDATVYAWKVKHQYRINRPFQYKEGLQVLISKPKSPSFPCERSVAAGAAAEMIAYYFPPARDFLDSLSQAVSTSRVLSGVQYPLDTKIGLQIGRAVAIKYIQRAFNDGTRDNWKGQVPAKSGLWTGDPGLKDPMKGQWKSFVMSSNDQFRPDPPPDFDEEMEELREFNQTHKVSDIAWNWKTVPYWDMVVDRMVFESRFIDDPLKASLIYSSFHIGRYEATIAAWEAKYYYWGIRPFQYDPNFRPILIETPNFPGYPAGHTAVAGSLATILSYFFPQESELFQKMALECSESRFEGGVHFRTDNEVGLELGRKVGMEVINYIKN